MSEAGAAGAGAGAGAAGEGAGAGAGAGAGGAGAGAGGAPTAWYSSFDADTQGWLDNRGLTKLDATAALPEVLKTARNAEKLLGVPADQVVRLPKEDSPDAWNPVYDRLGRPADPKEYAVPKGTPDDVAAWARETAHKLGLSKRQGDQWINAMAERQTQATSTKNQAYKAKLAQEQADLNSKWGAAREKNLQIAKVATNELGFDGDTIDKLEEALGYAKLMEMMHAIGSKMGEDSYTSGGRGPGFGDAMTPAQAQARISALRQDIEFVKRYNAGDTSAKTEMDRLHKYAYPG